MDLMAVEMCVVETCTFSVQAFNVFKRSSRLFRIVYRQTLENIITASSIAVMRKVYDLSGVKHYIVNHENIL